MARMIRKNKYGNQKAELDGHVFDSKAERMRYAELKMMEKAGFISDLQMQVPFELQPKFLNKQTGKMERAITYVADFVYKENSGSVVVEDVKSGITASNQVYRLKKKMMAYKGYYIKEVYNK